MRQGGWEQIFEQEGVKKEKGEKGRSHENNSERRLGKVLPEWEGKVRDTTDKELSTPTPLCEF